MSIFYTKMPQVCPSPSRQLEAAAAAFRKARQKFPRHSCSGDTEEYPMIASGKLSLSKSKTGGNQSMSSSRTASWSHDCRVGQRNGVEELCEACGGRRDCPHAPKQMISGLEDCLTEAASKSTHSSLGTKRCRHRRPCGHVRGRIQTEERICLLHGFPAARRRSSIPRKPQNQRPDCERKESPSARGKVHHPTADEQQDKVYYGHSPAMMGELTFSKDQVPRSSRNREASCKSCVRQAENSRSGSKKGREPPSDVCLRPSLIKAAQRRAEGPRSHQSFNLCGQHENPKSGWDENLPIINHKDSVSILMDRFRGNDKRSLRLRNMSELNSVLGSKTSCGEGGSFDDEESIDTSLPARKSFSGVNPVRKLGRVANQGLRENESRFKNLRARLNRSGVCGSSPKGTPCRRAL